MEQLLLQLINEEAQKPYSDSENQQLAAYLMGEADFKKIQPVLKAQNNRWYYYTDPKLRKITKDITQDKDTTLPLLGRFCRILRHGGNKRRIFDFLTNVIQGAVPVPEIYTAGGMGTEDLLADVLNNISEYWALASKHLGFNSYQQFFSHIYNTNPDAYEKLARDGSNPSNALFASAYLYAANPQKYASLEDKIITLAGPLLAKKAAEEAVAAAIDEPVFANSPFIAAIGKQSQKNAGSKADKFTMSLFFIACAAHKSLPILLEIIGYLLIYCEKHNAFYAITAAEVTINSTPTDDKHNPSFSKAERGVYPMAQFLAYLSNGAKTSESNIKQLKDLALKNKDHTLKALKLTDIRGGIILLSAFWEDGQLLDMLQKYEEKIVKTLEIKYEDLNEYFLGNIPDLPERAPMHNVNDYNLSQTTAYIVPYSKLPARLINYAFSFNIWPNFFGTLYWHILDIFGSDFAAKFIDELPNPDHEKIAALITSAMYTHSNTEQSKYTSEAARLASNNTELYEKAAANTAADARAAIITMAYTQQPDYNPDWLITCLGDSSKKVRDIAIAYLTPKTQLKPQIEELAKSKKKNQRESAEKLLMAYNATGTTKDTGTFDALAYVAANIPAKAPKTIEWTAFDTLPKVRLQNTEEIADDRIITGYIYLMVSQNEMALPRPAVMIRETLNKTDLRALGTQLYHVWKTNGAVSKHRAVLALAAIDGDDNFVRELTKDIQNWAEASRGALAAEATRALALQGGSLALMTVDSFSKKFKNKQVKRVAEEAFVFAAQQLGVDPEVLGDRIVPTLGFDSRGQQEIDYGNRQFTATITPDLQISLKNDQGKAIKSLPAVGASDDKDIAAAAKADFTTMKKNLKSVATLQCLRLEQALSSNRTWDTQAWNQLFVENPIMNMFAIGLVWGTYDKTGNIIASFRYMEDGSFVTADEDDITLPDDANIGLCHPLDLGEEQTNQWKQQLEDYEIKQPIDQLARKVFKAPEDKKITTVLDFGGAVVYAISLTSKLQKMGWYRGSVVDAGGFFNFYKEDKKQNMGVLLDFSGTYVGADHSEEVTVYDAVFYKAGTVNYGSYVYDEVKAEDRIPLHQVPPRFYSEVCYDIERAVANRIDTVEKWVKNR
ncbi:MAG: DUF4132 domain-containing protein [Defluviitaleaceae bacterium]|nr:DUF4132 domain-containing protein [Defluviitaleaceae bacterium]